MNTSGKLKGKDLINIGIYAAIYCVIMTAVAMLGFIPIMMPMLCVLVPLLGGIPYMLFMTKVDKFGMLTIYAIIIGLFLWITGMGYWPFLFVLDGKWKTGAWYLILYAVAYGLYIGILPRLSGVIGYLLLACCGILTRFLPGIMTGSYLIRTTKVSEFNAAMERMHVSEKISIPLSVMFRFFPTIADEFSSINDAMRMRDIRFGGKNVTKMIEYRLVPLLVCSAKIGEELNAAAITRGLGADRKRTNVCQIGFHAQDHILFTLCVAPYVIWAGALIQSLIV